MMETLSGMPTGPSSKGPRSKTWEKHLAGGVGGAAAAPSPKTTCGSCSLLRAMTRLGGRGGAVGAKTRAGMGRLLEAPPRDGEQQEAGAGAAPESPRRRRRRLYE